MNLVVGVLIACLLSPPVDAKDELGVSRVSASGDIAHSLLHLLAGGHVQVDEHQPAFTAVSWRARARDNKFDARRASSRGSVFEKIAANLDDLTSSTVVDHPDITERRVIEEPPDEIGFVEETGESNFVTEPPRKPRPRYRTPKPPRPTTIRPPTTTTSQVITLFPLLPTFSPLSSVGLGSLFPTLTLPPSNPFIFPIPTSTTPLNTPLFPASTTNRPVETTKKTRVGQGTVFKKDEEDDDEEDDQTSGSTPTTVETTETPDRENSTENTEPASRRTTTIEPDDETEETSDEPEGSGRRGSGVERGTTDSPTDEKCEEGRWSEWRVVSECSAECGACGLIRRERECLSFRNGKGCPCTGDYKQIEACSIGVCSFPRPSCCPPYNLIYIDKKFACGPQPPSVLSRFRETEGRN